MTVEILESSNNLVEIKIKHQLKKAEEDQLLAVLMGIINRWEKIKILVILEDFQGWERGADWGLLTFERDYDIEKIAIIGDEKWKDLFFMFIGQPFGPMPIEYFNSSELERAMNWLS